MISRLPIGKCTSDVTVGFMATRWQFIDSNDVFRKGILVFDIFESEEFGHFNSLFHIGELCWTICIHVHECGPSLAVMACGQLSMTKALIVIPASWLAIVKWRASIVGESGIPWATFTFTHLGGSLDYLMNTLSVLYHTLTYFASTGRWLSSGY